MLRILYHVLLLSTPEVSLVFPLTGLFTGRMQMQVVVFKAFFTHSLWEDCCADDFFGSSSTATYPRWKR